jgi:hypothetical protein
MAVMPVDMRGTGCGSVFCRGVVAGERVGKVGNLLIPDSVEDLIVGFEFIDADDRSPHLSALGVVDKHPVTLKLPADIWPGRVDRAGKPFTRRVLPHEDASFFGENRFLWGQIRAFNKIQKDQFT